MSIAKCVVIAAGIGGALAFSPPVGMPGQQFNLRGSAAVRSSSSLTGISMSSREASSSVAAAERRNFLRLAFGASAALVAGSSAEAEVFFDTERYGDKELKVALINQVKQQFRALYEKKPDLIIPIFKLALSDSLTYDAETKKGGLDGGVIRRILEGKSDMAYLQPAVDEIERIRKDLLAKTEVSCSDLLAFGGAVAIEATGGPRVKTQLGRIDGKGSNGPRSAMSSWDPEAPTAEGILKAFAGSGLSAQESVILAGCVGQLRSASATMKKTLAEKVVCNPEVDDDCQSAEEGYYGIYSPVTIRSETTKQFGKNRGASAVNSNTGFDSARIAGLAGEAKFGNAFLVRVAQGKDDTALGAALMKDDALKKWVVEYGKPGNDKKFSKEAVTTYLKLVELGRSNVR